MGEDVGSIGVRRLYEAITVVANEALDIAEALHRGLSHVCGAMGWPVGHAMLVAGDRLTPTEIWFLEDPDEFSVFREVTGTVTFELSEQHGPLRATATRREPTWLVDVTAERGFQRARLADDLGVRGAMIIPVLVGDESVAVLEFYSRDPVEPDRDVLEVMRYVGVQLGRVFERQRVKDAEGRTLDAERRYLRIAAHEMTAPLATASGYLQFLLNTDHISDEERERVLRAVRGALETLQRITTNFLIDARLHAGSIRAHTEATSVAKVVRDAVSDVPTVTTAVQVRCPDGLLVQADGFLLRQAIVNLLTNAERYGEPPVTVACRRLDGLVEMVVSDQGPGVEHEFVPRLFERFTRASDIGQGTGLGLEIVAGLVALQGGRVRYEPNRPRGASFIITLPHAPPPDPTDGDGFARPDSTAP
ncbi:MAG: HAMP domain-containing histidine kinase [Actinomycetota bacterium]|nr:HAMP domain-containing histidine kinase [Actinomycetota bacterium]